MTKINRIDSSRNLSQSEERLALHFVETAVLDMRTGGQRDLLGEPLLDLLHGGAEVTLFQARGHCRHVPQVFAPYLRRAFVHFNGRDARHRHRLASREVNSSELSFAVDERYSAG